MSSCVTVYMEQPIKKKCQLQAPYNLGYLFLDY